MDSVAVAVLSALADRHFDEAERLLESNASRAKGNPVYWRLRLRVASAQASRVAMERALRDLLDAAPADARLQLEAALLAMRRGRRRLARAAAEAAARNAEPNDPVLLDAIGSLLVHCDRVERGVPLLRQAVALRASSVPFLYNLAAAERMMGNVAAAREAAQCVLAMDADHAHAYHLLAGLRTWTAQENHLDALEGAIARATRRPADQVGLLFALAKETEDLGEYSRSIAALQRGNSLQRRMMRYDVDSDINAIDNIIRRFDSTALAAGASLERPQVPVFIAGLPRSGTTLLERMLDSHSAITGAGELQAFSWALIEGVRELAGGPVDKLQFADWSLRVDPVWLGNQYLAEVDLPAAKYFVDKLPLNYLYLGLIHRALPNAKLVVVDRDPVDSCFAIYRTLFQDAYPFSYDLAELARYYAAYCRLITHWERTLGPALYRVRYERFVTNPRQELEHLLAYLGLGWEEGCLEFHRGTAVVSTASATQVREPVHTRSVGRWKKFGSALDVLRNELETAGVPVQTG
jgi:hypothetical protein